MIKELQVEMTSPARSCRASSGRWVLLSDAAGRRYNLNRVNGWEREFPLH